MAWEQCASLSCGHCVKHTSHVHRPNAGMTQYDKGDLDFVSRAQLPGNDSSLMGSKAIKPHVAEFFADSSASGSARRTGKGCP